MTLFCACRLAPRSMDEDRRNRIADLTELGSAVVIAKGGNGGFGNLHFKSSTNQAPRRANSGSEGVERTIWLRLKLIADVGLLGCRTRESHLFRRDDLTRDPKLPIIRFTTLHPNLGVLAVDDVQFVIADIPGLIEGAHEGRGSLACRFLGHVERCSVLLHVIDGTSESIGQDYHTVIAGARGLWRRAWLRSRA